jgi:uncharacterized SAM-binding protein YcdF (DUF218 family)
MNIIATTIVLTGMSALLLLFLLFFRFNRTSLVTGFCFDAFLVFAIAAWMLLAISDAAPSGGLFRLSGVILALICLFIALFGVFILIGYLLANTRAVLKKESHSLSNSLALISAFCLAALIVVTVLVRGADTPEWLFAVWAGVLFAAAFYLFHVFVFLTTLALYNMSKPRIPQDYLVVLGCGLVDGKAPPLLAGRIDRALRFAKKQQEKTGTLPVLIMSGGRGADEPRPEADAMREYAVAQGYDPARILLEDQSTNTLENMRFSKAIMDGRARPADGRPCSCAFVSNGYHLLRAGICAKKAGLRKALGLGAKTARYYRPNAIIREYIAFLSMRKKRFVFSAAALFAAGLLLQFFLRFFSDRFVV